MSSAASTEKVRLKPDERVRLKPDSTGTGGVRLQPDEGFRPWHFFVLMSLAAATAAVLLSPQPTPERLILVSLAIGTAGFVGFGVYRTLAPLAGRDDVVANAPLGRRSRAGFEREKTLVLRAIKELEFDRAMGKVAERDFEEMVGRLRARARTLIRELDAGASHRVLIEKELESRIRGTGLQARPGATDLQVRPSDEAEASCHACGTQNDPDARFCKRCGSKLAALLLAFFLLPAIASTQGTPMPDMKQMSGVPLPTTDVPDGTVSVRVIRGSLSNNLPDQTVTLTAGGRTLKARTDASGRAQFSGLAAGIEARASATVGSETLASQPFTIPQTGGVRLLLVATDPDAEQAAAEAAKLAQGPPQPGMVVLGGQSRVVIEAVEDALEVYYLLDILNNARTPVQTPGPLVFELPEGATGATVLDGSSPLATAGGSRLTVTGPFPPGRTLVQVAYRLPHDGGDVTFEQKLPAALEQVTLVAEKAGNARVSSPQAPNVRAVPIQGSAAESGATQIYMVANGPALRAGEMLRVSLTGLPGHPLWARYTALTLATLILLAGAWAAAARRRAPATAADLVARRERLFAELTSLETRRHAGAVDAARYQARRRELVRELERVYDAMDAGAAA